MATTLNMVLADGFADRYSENVLNENLTFYKTFTGTVVSGSGLANSSSDFAFANGRSLFINNLSNSTTLVISAGGIGWLTDLTSYRINNQAIFQASIYNSSGVTITGRFNLYSNGSLLYVLEFSVSHIGGFKTLYQNISAPSGDFDITIELDDNASEFVECYVSGIKLEYDQDLNYMPTAYSGYIPKTYEATNVIDIPSIASNSSYTVVTTLTGAEVGDFVQMTYPAQLITLELVVGYPIVTDTDEISFVVHNKSGGAINPASGDYTFKIVK